MKRLYHAFLSDVRYQWRYGFYFIYGFMTVAFIIILRLLPDSWRETALVVTLLADPALLGLFFIGGLMQLERGEGILDALFSSPLRPWEYIASKALSLGMISTLVSVVVALGSGVPDVGFGVLIPSILFGSMCFTLLGIAVSVNLKTMNAFLSIDGLWELVLMTPPVLLLFNVSFLPLEIFPGSVVLRLIQASAGLYPMSLLIFIELLIWVAIAFWIAQKRLTTALSRLGGGAA
jgi:fluoroquinolone transport system permease protein